MIDTIPHLRALLPRTKLRWVDLRAVLNDGKTERASRVPAALCLHLGAHTDIVLLRDGESLTAARVEPSGRRVIRMDAVTRFAERERERAEVAFYSVTEDQQRAMWPCLHGESTPRRLGSVADLAAAARADEVSGVVEIEGGGALHWVVFDSGLPTEVHAIGIPPGSAAAAAVDLLAVWHPDAEAVLYGPPRDPPPQAPAALFSLYERLVQRAGHEIAEELGTDVTRACFTAARGELEATSPVLASFAVHRDGSVVADDAVVTRSALTDAVAAWLRAVLASATERGLSDADAVARRAVEPDRHALTAQGLVARLHE
ncbi:MAG TPA: hypothetical protein VK837_13635 [Longimicrobiales bacterium]|nr:hypothetical protein [Longimicrobiales bacterium]